MLTILDPAAALETMAGANLTPFAASLLRASAATELARLDPDKGTAVAESMASPDDRATALLKITDVLPADARARRIALLEKAGVHARAVENPDRKLWLLGDIAERFVDEGEAAKSRQFFADGLALARSARNTRQWRYFAARFARVDLAEALKLIDELATPESRSQALANTAVHIASSQPAECERLLDRLMSQDKARANWKIPDRMAAGDPIRARQFVGGFPDPYLRSDARLILARALAFRSKTEAEAVFREALADRNASAASARVIAEAVMLPLVAETDPSLVPEFLWHTLAQRNPITGLGHEGVRIRDDARVVNVVAHYDRDLAAALWETIPGRLEKLDAGDTTRFHYDVIIALARLDPRAAVAWVESQPMPARVDERGQSEPRALLSELLALWSRGRDGTLLPHVQGPYETLPERDLR